MQDGYNYNKPKRRRRRRKRINWTAVFFWLVVLMAVIAVIVLLVKPKKQANADVPTIPDDSYNEQWQPSATQKPEVTLPIVPETTVPVTDPPATNPPATNPPATKPPATEPPATKPPTEPPTEPPTTPPTEATAGVDDSIAFSSAGEKAAAVAKSALGMPYEYGGSGPGTFDTSGLIYYCFKESDVSVPRLVSQQAAHGTAVEKEDLLPGDVVFFYFDTPGSPDYVGIYVGGGSFIAARSSAGIIDTLSMNSSYYKEHFVCARRYY